MSAYAESVESGLAGLENVSVGACPGCTDCGLAEDCTDHERELADEPQFSWRDCECCGSTLGGDRRPAHGRDKNGEIVHMDVCTDCLMYLANGTEPVETE